MVKFAFISMLACFLPFYSFAAEAVFEYEQTSTNETIVEADDYVTDMIRKMAPVLISIDENKKLPKASNQMADKIKAAIDIKYNQNTSYIIDKDTNSIEFDGYYKKDNTVVKYRIIRNLSNTLTTYAILNNEDLVYDVANLGNNKIDKAKLKVNKINKNDYIGYANKAEKQIYLFTNIGAYLALQIEVRGDNFAKEVKDFIYALDFAKLKKAVADDGKNIEDIKIMINDKIQDPNKIDELFAK